MLIYQLCVFLMALPLLFLGRKLFWLFVGIVGFALGVDFSLVVFGPLNSFLFLGTAFLFGLLGAVLAVFLQRLTIVLSGFIGGGYFAYHLALLFKFPEMLSLLVFVIGAILGAVLFYVTFDWAIIIFSSLIGAIMVAQILPLSADLVSIIFIVCAVFGFIVQVGAFSDKKKKIESTKN